MIMPDPKQRFSSRVENYVKYRPGYPKEILDLLTTECGLKSTSIIADVGSGTGLLARLFLDVGCHVWGIEPNADMRSAGEIILKDYKNFYSLDGSAENTGLPGASVDLISVGQAFHWFNLGQTRIEFTRILKPGGWVVLVWNERRVDSNEFLRAYELLLHRYGTDYDSSNHRHFSKEIIQDFYRSPTLQIKTYENIQWFDLQGLIGRVLSSSYVPEVGQPGHDELVMELNRLFKETQSKGKVAFEYDTQVYYGQLDI